MVALLRTNSEHPDFIELVRHLDAELKVRDGDDHAFYNQFNKIDLIRHALVAYLDQTPSGCGAIEFWDDRTMEVKRMYVAPENRGKGIAGAILLSLEAWAAELGYERCILETGMNQPEAIRLYQKSDYIRIPNYGQYAGIENSVCFEKILK
ncbi:MAG: GNAT family N-acetyltransferase [Haliscomenobacter sp.]|nr:GNAT family N-acetyltransferase [Haliscomenobacter sp.]